MSRRQVSSEERLGWLLSAPSVLAITLVTAYPILYALWLSLFRYDLRFPDERTFVGLANYWSVLISGIWWSAFANTLLITVMSVAIELVLGMLLALAMHRALFLRRTLRATILVPYAIITVVAALAWRLAFDPATGFVDAWLGTGGDWLAGHWTSVAVIVLSEVWKTTPFMALLLLAGLTLVPRDLLEAARVDGAGAFARFFRITVPIMRPMILVALLFRTLDAFRIFDAVFILTRGTEGTETVSIVGYNTLVARLNLGLGSAVSVLIFLCVLAIAVFFVRSLGLRLTREEGE